MGRIGTAVAVRSKSFGLSICFYDPYLPVGIDKVFGYERYNNLYEMIKICDYVSLQNSEGFASTRQKFEEFLWVSKLKICFDSTNLIKLSCESTTIS